MRPSLHTLAAPLLFATATLAQDLYDTSIIRTIEVTAPANWRTVMANNYATKTYIKASVKIDNVVYNDVGVRHRGFSTYNFLPSGKTDKRPWKIAMDEFVPGQRVQGYRTLNINNNVWDPSVIREVAGYEFMRRYTPAPKCCYVKLKVNNEDLGLFCNTQQINKDFLQEWFEDDEGNRYRGERTSSSTPWNDTALVWLGTNQSKYQSAYELKTENGLYTPWVALIKAIDVLNNTPAAQLPAALPKVLDVDNALRFLAAGNVTAWLDSYLGRTCKNFYLYEDVHHGRIAIQPWDLNNGFGGLTDGLGISGVARLDPFHREVDPRYPRPLVSKLLQIPAWRARYLAHYRTMLPEFSWARMGARINALRTLIRPHLQADSKRIYTMQQFDDNMTKSINVGFVTVPAIQPFFQNREAFLNSHVEMKKTAPTLTNLTAQPTAPTPQQGVTVTVTVTGVKATLATLYYRTVGPFAELPMYDDGKHGDGGANDGVWGASIPPQPPLQKVQYYVGANNDLAAGGAMAFLPPLAEFAPPAYRVGGAPPQGPILISEFMAKNDNGLRDENGDRDDWIELTNIGTATQSISGMYLTDNVASPKKWQIPTGYSLKPGESLIIWADDETNQGPLHATFKLGASGEEVALYAPDGKTNLDWIAFQAQQPDISSGRLHGHLGFLATFPVPTPNQVNHPLPYGHLPFNGADPQAAAFLLTGQGPPRLGLTIQYQVGNGPLAAPGVVFISPTPKPLNLPGLGCFLLDPAFLLALPAYLTNQSGAATTNLAIPNQVGLAGYTVYLQSIALAGTKPRLSNGVATRTGQ